jgi:uncharacterized protein
MKTKASPVMLAMIAILTVSFSINSRAQSIAGDWYGYADIQGTTIRLNLHIISENGLFKGTFDMPEQGASGIQLTSVTLKDQNFEFSLAQAGLKYNGTVDPGFTLIQGKLVQGEMSFEMSFGRTAPVQKENSADKIKEIYNKQEVYIEMRDGIRLFTSIYTPKNAAAPAPMIIIRTPYNSEPGGESQFNYSISADYRFVKAGYIIVLQDVRGRYMSYGSFVNVRPFNPDKKGKDTDEASDTYDTADWLVKNVKNNNGRIGVMGISYPGFYATMSILANHPAIKAVSPQAPVTNWFIGDDDHHNGAFFLLDAFSFYKSFGDPMTVPSRKGSGSRIQWGTEDNYEFFMRMGPVKNSSKYYPDSLKYWHEMMTHKDYDAWWKARDPRPYLTGVQPAVMTVGGWFDAEDLWGALHVYSAIEKQNPSSVNNILVMGPWAHGQWGSRKAENMGNIYWGSNTSEFYQEMELKFFDYYLKGNGEGKFPEATVYMTGANEWKSYETWPPENISEKVLYFQPGGGLTFTEPVERGSFDEYVSNPMKPVPYREDVHLRRNSAYMTDDQRFAAHRPDVMVYQTEMLTEDMTFTGPLTAELYVSTTGTDADWVVKLIDVFPDRVAAPAGKDIKVPLGGYQMLVRGDVMRGRYRNSYEKPEAFVPGKITKVEFELPDICHQFKAGHKIMIQVQNSWFPLVDRNPQKFVDIYSCETTDFQKATMRVYHDKKNVSCLKVNLLKN